MNTFLKRDRVPGILYLLLAVTGFYTPYVFDHFNSEMNPQIWLGFVREYYLFFSTGIVSFHLMNLVWVGLAYCLYIRFKGEFPRASFILLISVILGAILVFITIVLRSSPTFFFMTESSLIAKEIPNWIERTHFIYIFSTQSVTTANLFYSIWLLPFAYLLFKTDTIGTIESILLSISLIVAAIGYFADFLIYTIQPMSITIKITPFTFYGEVVILLWMLIRGFYNIERESDKIN